MFIFGLSDQNSLPPTCRLSHIRLIIAPGATSQLAAARCRIATRILHHSLQAGSRQTLLYSQANLASQRFPLDGLSPRPLKAPITAKRLRPETKKVTKGQKGSNIDLKQSISEIRPDFKGL